MAWPSFTKFQVQNWLHGDGWLALLMLHCWWSRYAFYSSSLCGPDTVSLTVSHVKNVHPGTSVSRVPEKIFFDSSPSKGSKIRLLWWASGHCRFVPSPVSWGQVNSWSQVCQQTYGSVALGFQELWSHSRKTTLPFNIIDWNSRFCDLINNHNTLIR